MSKISVGYTKPKKISKTPQRLNSFYDLRASLCSNAASRARPYILGAGLEFALAKADLALAKARVVVSAAWGAGTTSARRSSIGVRGVLVAFS